MKPTAEGVNMATPQLKQENDQEEEKFKIGLTPGTAEGDRETVEESIRLHELKGDL
jgi:hypothetical protein